ncbi:hypothetical protein LTR56_004380 [Elasticomyces elasticus]|nr:hypothetical protein LTR56_004380 [Elasticomyces elasticus]KAK5757126.1 hypothetical protein LTS12_012800 [Elasticomyces elasticus]
MRSSVEQAKRTEYQEIPLKLTKKRVREGDAGRLAQDPERRARKAAYKGDDRDSKKGDCAQVIKRVWEKVRWKSAGAAEARLQEATSAM